MTYEVRNQFYQGHYRKASNFPIPNTQYTSLYLEGEDMSLTHEVPNQTHVTSYHSEKILTNYDLLIPFQKIQKSQVI